MMAPAARPKYRAALEARLRRMAAELERERVWLGISCGYTGATMESMRRAASELVKAAAAMDKELYSRRYGRQKWRRFGPFPRETTGREGALPFS